MLEIQDSDGIIPFKVSMGFKTREQTDTGKVSEVFFEHTSSMSKDWLEKPSQNGFDLSVRYFTLLERDWIDGNGYNEDVKPYYEVTRKFLSAAR